MSEPPHTHDALLRRLAPLLQIDWRKYRRHQSRRGLERRLQALGLADRESYLEIVEHSLQERERLLRAMRVTVTRFFRDPPVWKSLQEKVLPELAGSLAPGEPFHAWSAGCAGGEEAYTLAIVWSLLPEAVTRGHRLEILGTDIDKPVLARARRGRYESAALRKVPPEVRQRSFGEEPPGSWRVAAPMRECARFEHADLLVDPPPTDQQLVLCRYLAFTYYRGERLRAAAGRLSQALAPQGALVVGIKEHVPSELDDLLEPWPDIPAVFRARATVLLLM